MSSFKTVFQSRAGSAEEAFKSIDTNGDGHLSIDELMAAIQRSGAKDWPRSRIVYIVAMLDKDKDQRLNLDEFKRMLAYLERGHAVQSELQQAYSTIESLKEENEALRLRLEAVSAGGGSAPPPPADPSRDLGTRDAVLFDTINDWQETRRRTSEANISSRDRGLTVEALELHSKYAASGDNFTFEYGGVEQFFAGLEGLVGVPAPEVRHAMAREHASTEPFDSHNVFTTSPRVEWLYVTEKAVGEAEGRGHDASKERVSKERGHAAWRLKDFVMHPDCRRANLIVEEVLGIRLYTGPMYIHYNNRTLRRRIKGQFVTTLHAINSAILKLARHTPASTVYRGVVGGVLPEQFWKKNEHGIRGGIELGFMSTTTAKHVAMGFAGSAKERATAGAEVCSMVFVIHMGMIDRGASVSFLSQFPAENEILFAPLTGLEVVGSPHPDDGGILMVELRLSCNMHDLTLEEVIGKMQRSHTTLVDTMVENNVFAGAPEKMLRPLRELHALAAQRGRAYFNVPELFQKATSEALQARTDGYKFLATDEAWRDETGGADEVAARMRSAAQLCAREEQHDCAARLLMLAVQRQGVPAGIDEQIDSVFKRAFPNFSRDQLVAIKALALLLETALCRVQPWPLTTVQLNRIAGNDNFARLLATSYGVPTSCVMPQLFDEDATAVARKGSALLDAANRGDADSVEDALGSSAPDESVANGVRALMLAARQADLESTEALLAAGADPNARSRQGIAALNLAAEEGALPVVAALLAANANPDNADAENKTPLIGAALAGNTQVVMDLCECGNRGGGRGVNVNAQYGSDKWSALLRACQRGDTGVVEVLLAHGANVNIKQQGRITPLIIAAQEGRAETIKVLLEQPGIAIEDQLPGGRTALSQASKNGHIESVELLLAAKCNPSANSTAGSCLQLSRKGRHDKIVELLIAAGAKA